MAVLYFDNRSRDTSDTFLADGLTEELITRLGQVGRIDVKSRYESQRFRGTAARDPRTMGRGLRVAYLVSGTLQQAGGSVRLNVEMVRAASGTRVWGEVYNRTGGDILTIQADIAREVATAITGQLLPDERAALAERPTSDPVAYDLYLRASGALNSTSETAVQTTFELLDRALARDSTFAAAWALKAMAWLWLADGYMVPRTAFLEGRRAAERALRYDSLQGAAWAVLSNVALALDLDPDRAVSLGRRATAVAPRSAFAHSVLGAAFVGQANLDASRDETRRGFEVDTLDAVSAFLYLWVLNRRHEFDSMAVFLPRATAAMSAEDQRQWQGVVALRRGDYGTAASRISWRYYGGAFAGEYTLALVRAGRTSEARAALDSMVAFSNSRYFNPYGLAGAYAALGDADRALESLEQAWQQRTVWLCGVAYDLMFSDLKRDPRFGAFVRRVGLAATLR